MRTAGSPVLLEQKRFHAIELLRGGMSQVGIAAKLGVGDRTVRAWVQLYRRKGLSGLKAKPATGRPGKLGKTSQKKLIGLLAQGALACGYDTDLWTCGRVERVIEKRFGVRYHVRYVGRLLRSLGFTPQKPERRARERDERAIRRWVRREWPRIKKKPGGRKHA